MQSGEAIYICWHEWNMWNVNENACVHPNVCKVVYSRTILSSYYVAIEQFYPLKIGESIIQHSF